MGSRAADQGAFQLCFVVGAAAAFARRRHRGHGPAGPTLGWTGHASRRRASCRRRRGGCCPRRRLRGHHRLTGPRGSSSGSSLDRSGLYQGQRIQVGVPLQSPVQAGPREAVARDALQPADHVASPEHVALAIRTRRASSDMAASRRPPIAGADGRAGSRARVKREPGIWDAVDRNAVDACTDGVRRGGDGHVAHRRHDGYRHGRSRSRDAVGECRDREVRRTATRSDVATPSLVSAPSKVRVSGVRTSAMGVFASNE